MTDSLYLLRCFGLGVHLEDLKYLSEGDITGMLIESANDQVKYMEVATQEDIDNF